MNNESDEIRWLDGQRPHVDPPTEEATGWARASLLMHAKRSSRLVCLDSARERSTVSTTLRNGAGRRSRRRMAAAVAAAVVTVAAAAALVIGLPHGGSGLIGPAPASAAVLTLAQRIQNAPPLTGDATLVLHTNDLTAGAGSSTSGSFTGADLYLDDGKYYYGSTVKELRAAAKDGPIADFSLKPVMDAMSASADAGAQTARAAFIKAVDPLWGGDIEHGPVWQQDNVIWNSGIDLLSAAYGRPDVLAATLRVLSTVDGVNVRHVTLDGHDALAVSMKDPGSKAWAQITAASPVPMTAGQAASAGKLARRKQEAAANAKLKAHPTPPHLMTLTLDDQTGALLRYTDIGLLVTYKVSRVDAAAYGVR